MRGLSVSGITPRSNGSHEGDQFIDAWNRIVIASRRLESERRAELRRIGVRYVIPNDGWVTRTDDVPIRVPMSHPYGEYRTLAVGDRIAIGSVTDKRESMVGLYRVVRVEHGRLFNRADVEWDRDELWTNGEGRE
jgi:hypothetical protein